MGGQGSGKPKPLKKLIKDILPTAEIFSDVEESMYNDLITAYLSDFDPDELISSDMDDIMNLATNKVIAFRLLKEGRDDTDRQLDIATTLEKLDNRNAKLKENLSNRRRDRIDPNEYKGFSIVDLAVAYDQEVKVKQLARLEKLRKGEKKMLDSRSEYDGNRYDIAEVSEEKDD